MKKYGPVGLAIIIGLIFGNLIFDSYETEAVMSSDGNVYMLQYGAYVSEDVMKENIKNLTDYFYITEEHDDVYYIYLGVSTNYDNALNIAKIYKDKDIHLYIKENYLGNSNLIGKIKELDKLIETEKDDKEILTYVKKGLVLYNNNY